MNLFQYILNLVIVTSIVIILFFIAIRLSKASLNKMGVKNYANILEKINISKDCSVLVIKTGEDGVVGVATSSGFNVIKQLNKEDIQDIESKKNQALNKGALDFKILKNLSKHK